MSRVVSQVVSQSLPALLVLLANYSLGCMSFQRTGGGKNPNQTIEMAVNGLKWIFQRGRNIMRKYGVLFLLLADVFFKSANGKNEN